MRSVGIICECNPFHGGHQYLIDRARASGADAVICVLSGNFVQRGEAAILSPHARAEILAESGADAVFELPFPFSAAGAEFFGRAGVEILSRLGVDELWFGSESGNTDALWRLADVADSDAFREKYAAHAEGESGTAKAYFALLSEMAGSDAACAPNDILGVSYLRALRRLNSRMRPVTVKRQGSGYSEQTLSAGQFPSATALRHAWRAQGLTALDEYLAPLTASVAAREQEAGNAPASLEHATPLVLGMLRLTPLEELEQYAGLGGGLAGRMKDAASRATSLQEFYALCATKNIPMHASVAAFYRHSCVFVRRIFTPPSLMLTCWRQPSADANSSRKHAAQAMFPWSRARPTSLTPRRRNNNLILNVAPRLCIPYASPKRRTPRSKCAAHRSF